MFGKLHTIAAGLTLATIAAVAPAAHAAYPEKPVTIIVGYAPGGSVDIVARIMAKHLGDKLNKPFVVENRPGANGNIAANYVAKAKADGYTLLFGGSNHVANDSLYKNISFKFRKDLTPLALSASMANILVVTPSLPVKTVQELIDYAKRNPNALNYGSSGAGSSQHLSGELFTKMAGVNMTHVAYKGASPAATDLMGGTIQVMFLNAPVAIPYVKSNRMRALGITSRSRDPSLPEVKTVAEQGLAGYETGAWVGLFAPQAIDQGIAQLINKTSEEIAKSPEFQKEIQAQYMVPMSGGLDEIRKFVVDEDKKWSEIIRLANIVLD
ncbi:hypothetical protein AD428_02730 [Achromobacter sp. DMS1]|uniref:Bug family tripartite tricarboxylate transporter substrate binding protein n=1 Tax=Achromobacter sp. DMS1 TaxID=1688405 RepID=UPI00069F73BA|nr:tripartite tricarboxylate transporter substrate binding protein [Achromobacter sp. DMS1]KOF54680.1 hypothetical protein AD428_05315 [Achromobacter sp. DMS1]KOF55115.1 hypothetical protein AD428_02730 [Achromobacter sp. DMS1]